jgi:hypothetical protein
MMAIRTGIPSRHVTTKPRLTMRTGLAFAGVLVVLSACSAGGTTGADPIAQARSQSATSVALVTTNAPLATSTSLAISTTSRAPAATTTAAPATAISTAAASLAKTQPPTASTAAATTIAPVAPAAAVAPDIRQVDLLNALMPAGVCRWGRSDPQPIQLHGGKGDTGDRGSDNYHEIIGISILGYVDIDADGATDAVLATSCTGGGLHVDDYGVALGWDGAQLRVIGGEEISPTGGNGGSSGRIGNVRLDGTTVLADEAVQIGDEARCCYTGRATTRWTIVDGKWSRELVSLEGVPSVDEAGATLRKYFLTAGARKYQQAWDQLSVGYHQKYKTIAKFSDFWNGVRTAGIDSFEDAGTSTRNGRTITANVWYVLTDGSRSNEVVEVDVDHNASGDLEIGDYRFLRKR